MCTATAIIAMLCRARGLGVKFVDENVKVPINLKSGVYVIELMNENGRKNIQRLSVS